MSNRSLLDYLTNNYNDEYIINIDENGEITKIPYSPFMESEGEEYYERLIEEQKEKEKKLKKYKEKLIKNLTNFKEVKERKKADALLIINKDKLNKYDLRLNDFSENQIKEMEDLGYNFYYLKNTNPHDKRLSTIGFIKKSLEKPKRKN